MFTCIVNKNSSYDIYLVTTTVKKMRGLYLQRVCTTKTIWVHAVPWNTSNKREDAHNLYVSEKIRRLANFN